jgi:hypothetical protein
VSALPRPIQHSIGISSQSNKTRDRSKMIQIGKDEIKLSSFSDDMILKDPKNSTKTLRYHKHIQ